MRASKMYGIPGSFGQPSSAPPPPLDDQQAQDFTLVPALNSVLSLRYQVNVCFIAPFDTFFFKNSLHFVIRGAIYG